MALLAITVLLLTACTETSTTGRGSDVYDQKPKVCTTSQQNYYINLAERDYNDDVRAYEDARDDWLDTHNDSISGFTATAPADFVEPTGFDVTTHVLIYEGPGTSTLYRNQTFNIVLHPVDEGSDVTVTTVDAKASTTVRHSFSSLNELEVRITPEVNTTEFIPRTVTYRLFIPCQETWFIRVPYTLQENLTGTIEDLDVPNLIVQGDLGGINEDNPQAVGADEVLVLKAKVPAGGPKKNMVFEYNKDEILKIELEYEGEVIPRGVKPTNESLLSTDNREVAFGPIAKSGEYDILVFTTDQQPTKTIQIKLFNDDKLERAAEIFFTSKAGRVDLQDQDTRIVIAVFLIVFVLVFYGDQLFNGGKKR